MDTERNLLFGVIAFQNGAVDADRLAEAYAEWVTEPTQALADLFVDRGCMTDEQRSELEKVVAEELAAHGGDAQVTLAATLDGRSLEAIREVAVPDGLPGSKPSLSPRMEGSHVVLERLSDGETETRERYTLTHLHAKGGMGRVWLARDGALGRQIALKELRPDQTGNSIVCSRFLYEARITAQLEHPGIIPVYELCEGKVPYYTMRFVRGRTLSEAIRTYHKKRAAGKADSVELVGLLTAFGDVCHAVAYAHSRGIIHRDLKGQNVVLGDYGEVMVLDWGLAKRIRPETNADSAGSETGVQGTQALAEAAPEVTQAEAIEKAGVTIHGPSDDHRGSGPSASLSHSANGSADQQLERALSAGRRAGPESGAGPQGTMAGQLLGTPAYMAPEQAQAQHDKVDERTDVYGLGAILYEILTGRPPFVAPKTSEVIRKVCSEDPLPPRQILTAIAPELDAICVKALQKVPADRYSSASELAQEVQRYLADEPVKAYDEPWSRRVLRWSRRHMTLVSTAAGLLVMAAIALSISTALVSRERNEAEAQGKQARQAVHLLTRVADIGFEEQLDPLQKDFLEKALAYYEQFTIRATRDPAVRLEQGRAYQQMGDMQRKLGHYSESEQAYGKALAILGPLSSTNPVAFEAAQALARTRTLLADLLVRRGGDKSQAEPLYQQAREAQEVVAHTQGASAESQLRLGQTLKSQGDLLRLDGKFTQAKITYDEAITLLEQAQASSRQGEGLNNLALAIDARGWIYRELGDVKKAEEDYRRAQGLLEKLVSEFPTVPRHREALARVYNSLGLIEESTGRLADAEKHLRAELPLVERLAKDFPDRPEHRREWARTLINLGDVLLAQGNTEAAEPVLRQAVAVNREIAAKYPEDVQIQLDLAKTHNNLGEFVRQRGDARQAIGAFQQARAVSEKLVKRFPDKPRYREELAGTLANLALAIEVVEPAQVERTYQAALGMYEKLVADFPDNVEYRVGQARCMRNFGPTVADTGRPGQAEAMYRKALALLEPKNRGTLSLELLRDRASVLNNLGDLQVKFKRPGAEDSLRAAVNTFESLVKREAPTRVVRHHLSIVQNNMGELLLGLNRLPEAASYLTQSVTGLEQLVAEAPRTIDFRSHFGQVLEQHGKLLARNGKPDEAKTALTKAVAQQREAMRLGKDRDDLRGLLGSHLIELARVNLKLGAYQEAADDALEVPHIASLARRGQSCLDAARVLARLVVQVGGDMKLAQAERDRLARNYLGRTIVLLRDAVDSKATLGDQIRRDPDIKLLESRPEFQTIMNTLVDLAG
jgi:serine/threonine protein kinase/Tfp pilus assembly protein PilF